MTIIRGRKFKNLNIFKLHVENYFYLMRKNLTNEPLTAINIFPVGLHSYHFTRQAMGIKNLNWPY